MKDIKINKKLSGDLAPLFAEEDQLPIEVSTDEVRIKNLHVSGNILKNFVEVGTTERHIIGCGYYTNSTGKKYVPLIGYNQEQGSTTSLNEWVAFVAPYDGYLEFAILRSEANIGETVVGLHVSETGTENPNSTAQALVTRTHVADDTPYMYHFTGYNNSFSQGDILAISVDPTNAPYDTNITIVFVFEGVSNRGGYR